jgi:hypothetical protein
MRTHPTATATTQSARSRRRRRCPVQIDRFDRLFILTLNNIAAGTRRQFEAARSDEARGVFRALLNLCWHDVERAVAVATRRAA